MSQSKGLEGVYAGQSSISSIVGTTLTYRGIKIEDLAEFGSFEEIVFLLWFDKLPNKEELNDFKHSLASEMFLPEQVLSILNHFPKDTHSMTMLRTAISALAMFDKDAEDMSKEANIRKSIRLQAKMPCIVAAISRLKQNLPYIKPKPELSYVQNFLYMLHGSVPKEIEIEAFNKALILHADHEFNASTFSSRVTVATLSDIYSGITSAIGTLKGPLHGGANEQVMKMLKEIGSVEKVETYIQNAIDEKKKIMGIGHRVYKDGDPRAFILKKMSQKLTEITGKPELYLMSDKIEQMVFMQKGLKPNVDFYSASVYDSLGIDSEIFTPIFAISRTSGWIAHILEQYADNRIIRPRAEYIGKMEASYIPLEKRN